MGLIDIKEKIKISDSTSKFKKIVAFMGPAFLVSIGYMDPGNWSTDLQGGAQFGYKLIFVLLISNIVAIFLQSLAFRMGVIKEIDLAQATRLLYPQYFSYILYGFTELAIIATDIAEIIGMTIGLKLLFGIPIILGLVITIFDTFLFLFLIKLGIRKVEAFILAIILVILICFIYLIFLAKPNVPSLIQGFIPSKLNSEALYISLGIIGATVMPHNLYLHSSLAQSRIINRTDKNLKQALKYNLIDSIIALNLAFFINAAILILAASVFFGTQYSNITKLQDAFVLLEPLLGTIIAPIFFAIALIASGQSATITGTMAGQIVMEGFINIKISPWLRRLMARLLACLPTLFIVLYYGENQIEEILIFSQVFLSIQLALTIIPLIHFVSLKKYFDKWIIKNWKIVFAWTVALVLVFLNIKLVYNLIVNQNFNLTILILVIVFYIYVVVFSVFYPLVSFKKHK